MSCQTFHQSLRPTQSFLFRAYHQTSETLQRNEMATAPLIQPGLGRSPVQIRRVLFYRTRTFRYTLTLREEAAGLTYTLQSMANGASTPDGYALIFNNLSASLQASNYMGLYTLTSYDTITCASKCDQVNCLAFNVYLERDPSLNLNAQKCPTPQSTTNYKCTLWGAPVSAAEATNTGQTQDSFQVVIAGSNGYNKDSSPSSVDCYSGPQELGGAINAPPSSDSYMGYQYFPFSQSQGYDPQTCADACDTQTQYNSAHPATDGSFMSCVRLSRHMNLFCN